MVMVLPGSAQSLLRWWWIALQEVVKGNEELHYSAQGKALLRWCEFRTQQSVPLLDCVSFGFLLCAQTQKSSLSSVLFSHPLVCIPAKRILLLRLFSLGENGGG